MEMRYNLNDYMERNCAACGLKLLPKPLRLNTMVLPERIGFPPGAESKSLPERSLEVRPSQLPGQMI